MVREFALGQAWRTPDSDWSIKMFIRSWRLKIGTGSMKTYPGEGMCKMTALLKANGWKLDNDVQKCRKRYPSCFEEISNRCCRLILRFKWVLFTPSPQSGSGNLKRSAPKVLRNLNRRKLMPSANHWLLLTMAETLTYLLVWSGEAYPHSILIGPAQNIGVAPQIAN